MSAYNHKTIEEKWVKEWIDKKTYTPNLLTAKNPYYNLMMFPYPSAEGLHVGNMYAFTGADVFGRYQRMKGYDVFEPIGLDGFGIHSENYAIKVGKHPAEMAKISQERFYKQLSRIGNGFAWDHRLETYDPDYYKWTQWLFAEMFKRGLAYRKSASVNWCPSCKTVLADEQVEDGLCERCKSEVGRKEMKQWFFRITKYADRLLSNIEKIDWPDKIKIAQRNWIGKSKGLNIDFTVDGLSKPLTVWTKFWETVFGTTFIVVAPEHALVSEMKIPSDYVVEVKHYIEQAKNKSDQERKAGEGDKTGVFTGVYAVNPVNGEKVPIWIADYVLSGVGTGAVMGVPAHDERDFMFARKYKLPIRKVVDVQTETHSLIMKDSVPDDFKDKLVEKHWYTMDYEGFGYGVVVPKGEEKEYISLIQQEMKAEPWYAHADGVFSGIIFKGKVFTTPQAKEANEYGLSLGIPQEQLDWNESDNYMFCHEKGGSLTNSGDFNGLSAWGEGKEKMAEWMIEQKFARWETTFHLRDWLISRQRYWGPPIPMVYCETCAKRKLKILVIHGTWGSGDGNWFPWLEKYLSAYDVKVARPTLPDSKLPDYETRMAYIEKEYGNFIDEDTIVIGHSSGSATALHIAERYNVKQILLVSPIISVDNEYKNRLTEIFDAQTADALQDLYKRPVEMAKVQENNRPITVLFSDDDPYLPKSFITDAKKIYGSSNVFIIPNGGYLSEQYVDGFEQLLDFLPMNEIEMAGWHSVPEAELPVLLPNIANYQPTGDETSPLQRAGEDFLYTKCPHCGSSAKRETDVSDTFLDSSWYFLAYPTWKSGVGPETSSGQPVIFNKTTEGWLPVTTYIGGAEHAVLHLLYSRFVWMALKDWGYLSAKLGDEPFPFLFSHGLIVKDGAKMSKSRGNVVVPDEYIEKFGSDTLRMYLMFLGPYDQGGDFRDSGIAGMYRFLSKIWEMMHDETKILNQVQDDKVDLKSVSTLSTSPKLESKLHETIRKMDRDMAAFKYNTAIAALMELVNVWREPNMEMSENDARLVVKLLAPFAPCMSEEIWQAMTATKAKSGKKAGFNSVHLESYPTFEQDKIQSSGLLVVVQVNGKKRGEIIVSTEQAGKENVILDLAKKAEGVEKWLADGIRKEFFVPAKGERQGIVNFVV